MKKIITILACFICFIAHGQTYNPSLGTTSNKPYAPAQATPTDARTYFHDAVNFTDRPYQSTSEVLTYLNLPKYRTGQFPIVVNFGGFLSAGLITGGVNILYYFQNGTADSNLVVMIPASGACTGCLLSANNLSDVSSVATARSNLGLGSIAVLSAVAAGDLSGTWPNIVVAKFNGQLPSFYQNYNNLFNTPTIPAQLNPSCVGCSISGSYPNLTWTVTGAGFTTAGVDLIALSSSTVALDTLHYRKMDTIYSVNDSLLIFSINGFLYPLSVKGGNHGGGGSTGTVTIVTGTNANGIVWSISNPTSIPNLTISLTNITPTTVNGLTLATVANGFTITGGTGTPHTLTVNTNNTSVAGSNTGDVTLAGETYLSIVGQVITANPVNLSGTNVTGTLAAARFGALTGDVTNSVGSYATTISAGVVTNAKLATMPQHTFKGNNTGSTGAPLDLTATQLTAELNIFTASLKGLVPFPTTISGKVLSDNGTWVTNGAGSFNSHIGPGYWIDNGSSNVLKTFSAGFGVLVDSLTSNTLTFRVDTSIIAVKGLDSIFVVNAGPANSSTVFSTMWVGNDTIYGKKWIAGANVTFTQNSDSSIRIDVTSGALGGVQGIGTINTQTASVNGLVISGTSLYAQYATPLVPGMIRASGAQTIGATLILTVAPTLQSLSGGGVMYIPTGQGGQVSVTNNGVQGQTLHWNAGQPQFLPIDLNVDLVQGILPIPKGGTGTSNPSLVAGSNITIVGTWPNQTISTVGVGTVTVVSASGGTSCIVLTVTNPTTTPSIAVSGTLNVSAGGLGISSLTPNAPIVGGGTTTGPVQQVSNGSSTSQYLQFVPGGIPVWSVPGAVAPPLTSTYIGIGDGTNLLSGSNGFKFSAVGSPPLIQLTMGSGLNLDRFTHDISTVNFYFEDSASIPSSFSGFNNVMIGNTVGKNTSTGGQNVGLGYFVMSGLSSGSSNVGVGVFALSGITTGSNNLGFGRNAGSMMQTGSINIAIGSGALSSGHGTQSASNNIEIGFDSATSGSPTNWTYVGHGNKAYLINHANFGDPYQLISFGNNGAFIGGNTATANAFAKLAGDIFYITDSSAYCMWNGTSWIKWGGSSVNPVSTLEQVLTAGSTLTTDHVITYTGHNLQFAGTTFVYFSQGIKTSGFIQLSGNINANYVMLAQDNCLEVDASGGNRTISLPSSTAGVGSTFSVKKIDATTNTVTVNVVGGGNIDGASTYVLRVQYDAATFVGNAVTTGAYDVYSTNNSNSGSYTPTVTNILNVTSSTALICYWQRIGNIVTVYGSVNVTPTASSSSTQINMSLPVTSNFTATADAKGPASNTQGVYAQPFIQANSGASTVQLNFVSANTSATTSNFSYMYIIH